MLSRAEKNLAFNHTKGLIAASTTGGIDTRALAVRAVSLIQPMISSRITRFHIFGITSALLRTNSYILCPRKAGSSKIVKI